MLNIPGYSNPQTIYQGNKTIIYKATCQSDNKPLILKTQNTQYPSPGDIARIRHEHNILTHLNQIEGIVKPLDLINQQYRLILILEYFDSISLEQYITSSSPIPIPQYLNIAIQLSHTLAQLHQHNIIHKDIKPQNILIDPETQQTKIIDFSIATRLETETQTIINPDSIEGTLAYMSPEQTGRMNRTLDYRTDFYSLGITLYQTLTKQLPFYSDDPMELVHSHIAKTPTPPHQINPQIPIPISSIISKLLSKNAEDRYQSAFGLKADLEQCLHQLETTGKLSHFIPGERDQTGQFIIPQKLYGRQTEVNLLLQAFDRVTQSNREIMLVTGYSGIGKTRVVNEVHKPIVKARGYFIAGKFDQFKRDIPYAAVTQAFQELIRQLLTETTEKVTQWKEKLLIALGENAQIIIDVIPELELILGKQPEVAQLGATESQNRFNRLFGQFIRVFAQPEHPLVLFLDDLQWADLASLNLIELLMTDSETKYLLFLGAYRDNEVSPVHPTIQTLDKIRTTDTPVENIVLEPLNIDNITELVADTLTEERTKNIIIQLADLLYNKTQGNPFFLTELFKTLYTEELLKFDYTKSNWEWDIEEIQSFGVADLGVVELVARNIQKLSLVTQKVLKLAACVGNKFSLDVLAIVNEKSPQQTAKDLWSALQRGLILPLSQDYKIPLLFGETDNEKELLFDESRVGYRFLHDRVQQAAYSLIPDTEKQKTHLKIGRLLLRNTAFEKVEENVFDIVNQLNIGKELISETGEKRELVKLNLLAGKKAKGATAYEAAGRYLNVGLGLLQSDGWESDYELTRDVYIETLEVEYLNVNFERAQQLSEVVLSRSKSDLEKAKVYELKIPYYHSQNQFNLAIETGLESLKILGVNLPKNPNKLNVMAGLIQTKLNVSNKSMADLANLPIMTDFSKQAALRILVNSIPASYNANPMLFPLIIFQMVNISLKYGNSSLSAVAYAYYGQINCAVLGDIETGYQFGQLSLKLLEKFNSREIKAKVYLVFNAFIRHWKEHIKETLNPLLEGFQTAVLTGDLDNAGSLAQSYAFVFKTWTGEHLETVKKQQKEYLAIMGKFKLEQVANLAEIWQNFVFKLLGENKENPEKKGSFNEEEKLRMFQENNNLTGKTWLLLSKYILLYLLNLKKEVVEIAETVEKSKQSMTGLITFAQHNFYYSLSLLAHYPNSSPKQQKQYLKKVKTNQKQMKTWAHHAPMNFQHKYDLVAAETAKVLGQYETSATYYEKAISGASENGYTHEEAIANERAAEFYLSIGREKVAKAYMTEAYYCYIRWGATAKVQDLDQRHSNLILRTQILTLEKLDFLTTSNPITTQTTKILDFNTILKASQTLSREIHLEQLLIKLIKLILTNAGAQRCCLILQQNEQLLLQAEGTNDEDTITVLQAIPLADYTFIPQQILNFVARTRETVVLANATTENNFSSDPYIIQKQLTSILCSPLIHQGQLNGIVYLENNISTGAFTIERVNILSIICAQAAISIENALLYTQLEEYSKTLEQKVSERTAQLTEVNQQLSEAKVKADSANQAKSEFLANMSHELRTPLNGVLGYAQILQRSKDIDKSQKEQVGIIYRCGSHLLTLINDVLDLSKIEARRMELEIGEFHFPAMLQSVVEMCRIKAEMKKVNFIYQPDEVLPLGVRADQKRLRQVLINLIGNAIKFTDEGSVTFSVATKESLQSTDESPVITVRFSIIDTGIGMTPEQQQKLFRPFEQVGQNQRKEGTGLGLAISQTFVKLMGGEIQVESQKNVGSTFWFELDLPTAMEWMNADHSDKYGRIVGVKGVSPKVLVVDDKWENRSVIVNLLKPIGFQVLEAVDGVDAWKQIEMFHPDLIITDLLMPGEDGFNMISKVRSREHTQGIPILTSSASVFDTDMFISWETGADDFLPKPVLASELFDKLQKYLNLEWVFNGNGNGETETEELECLQVVPPSQEELEALLDLALKGSMKGVIRYVQALEKQNEQCVGFTRKVHELAREFRDRELIGLIEGFLGEAQGGEG